MASWRGNLAGGENFLLWQMAFTKSLAHCRRFLMVFKTKPERVAVKIRQRLRPSVRKPVRAAPAFGSPRCVCSAMVMDEVAFRLFPPIGPIECNRTTGDQRGRKRDPSLLVGQSQSFRKAKREPFRERQDENEPSELPGNPLSTLDCINYYDAGTRVQCSNRDLYWCLSRPEFRQQRHN